MKIRLLNFLSCPFCGGFFRLHSFLARNDFETCVTNIKCCERFCGLKNRLVTDLHEKIDEICPFCHRIEVVDGLLKCRCGSIFPIVDEIPRLLTQALANWRQFLTKYQREISYYVDLKRITIESYQGEKGRTKRIFSLEWQMLSPRDPVWGMSIELRKNAFIEGMDIDPVMLKNKILLDAGCGNGTLSIALSDFGLEVVGLDLSLGIEQANQYKKEHKSSKSGYVHLVQGDILNPPLQRKSFDFIYSAGVLHHTPDTEQAFRGFIPLLKSGGRMYIWLYKNIFIFTGIINILRWFTTKTPPIILYYLCYSLAPIYKLISILPEYSHNHDSDEVRTWFLETGFKNVTLRSVGPRGFGMYGDRI